MAPLFYVIGPSGSGKDSLIAALRERLSGQRPVLFAHRYITRTWSLGDENHVELSDAEYDQRHSAGLFSIAWGANNCRYAVGVEVDSWLATGHSVIVNGSRGHLEAVRAKYGQALVPVRIHVDSEQLRERLLRRGRETPAEIDARLARNEAFQASAGAGEALINNSGTLDDAVAQFEALLERLQGEAG